MYLLVKKVQNHRILTRNIVTKRNYTKQKILNMFKFAKHGDLNGIKSIAHTLSPLLINQKDDNRNTALYYAAL